MTKYVPMGIIMMEMMTTFMTLTLMNTLIISLVTTVTIHPMMKVTNLKNLYSIIQTKGPIAVTPIVNQ